MAIAVTAVIVACILLAVEMNSYEWAVTPKV
jgi:type IV secretory pathway VirB2 component (pilin)